MDRAVSLRNVCLAYGASPILRSVNLDIARGDITVLVGPNGCGKSTLLKAVRRLLSSSGTIELAGDDVVSLSPTALARRMALLTQSPTAPEDLTVFGVVRLGRYPHQSFFQQWTTADADTVEQALEATGLTTLRDRQIGTLSGGQRQRVWLAMVLAQNTPVLCLDEPINHLDIAHQLDCLHLVADLKRREGKTIVVVLHDINLAARFADRLVVMKDGRIVAEGAPRALLTPDLMREVFGVEAVILTDPVHDSPLCVAHRSILPEIGGHGTP